MAKGTLNKVLLIGRLGKDPEIRFSGDGRAMASFSIATNESWKDKEGNQQGAVVGVLQLFNKATGKFDDNDIQFMTKFMAIVGPILEQSSLYEKATGGKEQ